MGSGGGWLKVVVFLGVMGRVRFAQGMEDACEVTRQAVTQDAVGEDIFDRPMCALRFWLWVRGEEIRTRILNYSR
jgi:hypothetical protein